MDHPRAALTPRVLARLLGLVALTVAMAGCGDLAGLGAQPTAPPVVIIVTATPVPGMATVAPMATSEPVPSPETPTDPNAGGDTPTAEPIPAQAGVLERVRERGRLICGTNADLPGFGFYDSVRAAWTGFDVDFCRAVAVAVLGPNAEVEYVGLTTAGRNERFEAVRSGAVDVLFRNTTWTLGRDITQLAFGPTTFHDGQTFMVRTNAGVATSADLAGLRICVSRGTTSEQNLNDDFGARGIPFEPVLFDDENLIYPAYDRGDCDAVTSDSSQLASKRQTLRTPSEHVVLGERISREPLGPAFIEGDEQWRDVVAWVVFATMYAEELQVSKATVENERVTSTDPRVRRLLGLEGNLGEGLGLSNEFGYYIVSVVGNYGDIYDRNLGPTTPFALDRGPNKAWNLGAGGVLASPPFR